MKKILSFIGLSLVLVMALVGFSNNALAAAAPNDVVINEFVLDGTQWVEIKNTTASDINLTSSTWQLISATSTAPGLSTTTLSGLLPAMGLITFAATTTPDILSTTTATNLVLINDGISIFSLSYGTSTGFGPGLYLDGFPGIGESVSLLGTSSPSLSTSTPISKGWFNETLDPIPDCTNPPQPGEGLPVTLNAIATCLAQEIIAGVTTNMASSSDPTMITGLYFDKATKGRITYSAALNLTDQNNRVLISTFGTKMKMNRGRIGLKAASSTIMQNLGATISIYGMTGLGYDSTIGTSSLMVLDDNDLEISTSSLDFPEMPSISWDAGNDGTLTFDASHFTDYGPNPILAEVTPVSTPTASTSPAYNFSSNVAGTAIYGGACAMASASTTVGNNIIQFGPLTAATYSDCTIQVIDNGGASTTLLVTPFTVTTGSVEATVDLGTAGNFVILAKSGITGGAAVTITGDIGVSPIAATAMTGFGPVLDSSGTFSTSAQVTGRLYAADYTSPTPSMLTTAVSDMETAYTDASTRATPDETNLGAGNIGGMTLAPGLYKWTTGVTIPTDLTLTGSSTAVWIFQIDGTLNISNGKKIILSGGADAANIFWAVAGETTLGTTAEFKGNILCTNALGLHLNNGATLTGRALSTFNVTLDTNTISAVSPSSAKAILSFTIPGQVGSTTINEASSTVAITVPFGTDVTALVPTIAITGASISPVSGAGNNFTTPSTYTVTAANSSTHDYTVTVTIAPVSTIATVTSGSYTVNDGASTITNVTYGVASSTFLGNLTKGEVNQTWDISNIANPVVTGNTLVVTAQDASTTKTYTITVNANPTDITAVATDKAALISASSSLLATNSAWTSITATLSALPATGTASSSAIAWASASTTLVSNNGQTVNRPAYGASNATTTLTATISSGAASDTFVINLTVLASFNPAKSITGFTIPSQVGSTTIDQTAYTITVVMPSGTDPSSLTPTVTTTGSSTSPATGVATDFTATTTYTVTALDATTRDYVVTVQVLSATQTAPDGTGAATISTTTPEVVITDPTATTTLTINSGVTDPTIDVSAFIGSMGTGTLPAINITSNNANGTEVAIPASTLVTSASTTWDGIIAAPTVTTVTLPTASGYTSILSTAIELGFSGVELTFDKGVRILLPDQAGKRVGYTRNGGTTFTEITATCAADNQVTGDALSAGAECKIDVGSDLVIWTKHFTSFASFTQIETTSGGSSGSVAIIPVVTPVITPVVLDTSGIMHTLASDLKLGSQGTDVVELQKALVSGGYLVMPAGISMGYFGSATKEAVIKYQIKNNIQPAVGNVGPLTRAKINESINVRNLVNLLIQLGIISPDKEAIIKTIIW